MKTIRLAAEAARFGYVVWEKVAPLFPSHPAQRPMTWPLNPADLERLVVRWPARYDWAEGEKWMRHLIRGIRRHARVETVPLAQPYRGDPRVVSAEFVLDGRPFEVVFDYSDYAGQVRRDCLASCFLYFKMQYRRGGYGTDRVVPGGYVNPSRDYYEYLPTLRTMKDRRPPAYQVYGRFGTRFSREIRERAIGLLSGQRRFRYEGALSLIRYTRSLTEAARAQVCIDLPGNGPLCFRFVDYLGIGACVIAPRHQAVLHVPLEDRIHVAYAKDDLSDLVDLCEYYLQNDDARQALVRNSQRYFDRYLHRDQLGAYYLSTFFERAS